MMRIGIPNGIVSASQLRVIGGLTRKYARNLADITVRQNIQLHWLTIESLPEWWMRLTRSASRPKARAATWCAM
jgi:sulfite reductase (ferredoxin)